MIYGVSYCFLCLPGISKLLIFTSGTFDNGKSFNDTHITKWEMRRRLVYICKFAPNARPSRGNLKQVFSFLSGGRNNSV